MSPTASKRYSSTTSPVLRSRSRTVVVSPGSTVAEAGSREVHRITPRRYADAPSAGHRPWGSVPCLYGHGRPGPWPGRAGPRSFDPGGQPRGRGHRGPGRGLERTRLSVAPTRVPPHDRHDSPHHGTHYGTHHG